MTKKQLSRSRRDRAYHIFFKTAGRPWARAEIRGKSFAQARTRFKASDPEIEDLQQISAIEYRSGLPADQYIKNAKT